MTFEEFAATRMPGVLRFAAVLTGDRATAEDLAQEVLIRAYARWDRIGCLDRPELYVRKMMLNEFLNWRRRSSRQIPAGGLDQVGAGERAAGIVNDGSAVVSDRSRRPCSSRPPVTLTHASFLAHSRVKRLTCPAGPASATNRAFAGG